MLVRARGVGHGLISSGGELLCMKGDRELGIIRRWDACLIAYIACERDISIMTYNVYALAST